MPARCHRGAVERTGVHAKIAVGRPHRPVKDLLRAVKTKGRIQPVRVDKTRLVGLQSHESGRAGCRLGPIERHLLSAAIDGVVERNRRIDSIGQQGSKPPNEKQCTDTRSFHDCFPSSRSPVGTPRANCGNYSNSRAVRGRRTLSFTRQSLSETRTNAYAVIEGMKRSGPYPIAVKFRCPSDEFLMPVGKNSDGHQKTLRWASDNPGTPNVPDSDDGNTFDFRRDFSSGAPGLGSRHLHFSGVSSNLWSNVSGFERIMIQPLAQRWMNPAPRIRSRSKMSGS